MINAVKLGVGYSADSMAADIAKMWVEAVVAFHKSL
jgi:hypothetical protein